MSDHIFHDADVDGTKSHADIGNADVIEIQFNGEIDALNVSKDDIVHLAKCFGLVVYEPDSAL